MSELVAAVGSTQPNVSRHLSILQSAGLVGGRQEGTSAFYSVADPTVFALCDAVYRSIGQRLTGDAGLAEELRRGVRPG